MNESLTSSAAEPGRAGRKGGRTPTRDAPTHAVCPTREACGRVLVVEDESRLREMLGASIREMGLECHAAGSAEAGWKVLERTPCAIALLDLNLPGMGGLELAEALRKRWPWVQVVILTGFGDLEAAKKAIHLDVVDFLTKPCGMDELETALNRARLRCLEGSMPTPAVREPTGGEGDENDEEEEDEGEDGAGEVARGPAAGANEEGVAPPLVPPTSREARPMSLEEGERQMILTALRRHQGNREATAAELGISVRKLYYRLQQYQQQGLLPLD